MLLCFNGPLYAQTLLIFEFATPLTYEMEFIGGSIKFLGGRVGIRSLTYFTDAHKGLPNSPFGDCTRISTESYSHFSFFRGWVVRSTCHSFPLNPPPSCSRSAKCISYPRLQFMLLRPSRWNSIGLNAAKPVICVSGKGIYLRI